MMHFGITKKSMLVPLFLLVISLALSSCTDTDGSSKPSDLYRSPNSTIGTLPDYDFSLPSYDFSFPDIDFAVPNIEDEDSEENEDVIVYITETGEKYHRSGCQYLRKSKIPISLESAVIDGYERCSKCNPPRLE